MTETLGRRRAGSDSTPGGQPQSEHLTREQQIALLRIRALWNERPREVPRAERAVAKLMVEHRIPVEQVMQATLLPYVRVVRIVKRATGKMPSALAITEARVAEVISQAEMIALLSNREYDPAIGTNTGLVDVRQQPNSVSVLQQAYLRGLVTQGELWAIGDSITVRAPKN